MKKIVLLTLVVVLLLGLLGWRHYSAAAQKPPSRDKVVKADFATVGRGDAPVEITAIGQVASYHSVAIRPQVTGTLKAVYFAEGDDVKAGQKLFLVDPAPYAAALAQAEAQAARDHATANAAEVQERRLIPLAEKGYVTPQELLDAKAAAATARAAAKASDAAASAARITAGRTLITAPIAGRTGSLTVKSGNIVGPGDASPLVTINQLHPVLAEFTVPQSQLAAVQAAVAKGNVAVKATGQDTGQDTGTALAEGRLVFVDNTVDAATGTVKLKAEFDNAQENLWPGTFVALNVTLAVEHDVVLIPEQAVQAGASGPYVYRVSTDSKALLTPVKVARQTGGNAVIAEGLQGGETIVARAPRDLRPDTKVADARKGRDSGASGKPEGATPKPRDAGADADKPRESAADHPTEQRRAP